MRVHRAQIRYSAIGLVVALAVAGCASTADPTAGGSTAAEPDPSSTVAATGEPSATAEATAMPEQPDDWEDVASFGDGDGVVSARAVVHGSAGFLVFGERWVNQEGGPRVRDRFLWRSADGTEWQELPAPEQVDELSLHRVFTGTAGGDYLFLYQQPHPFGTGPSRMIGLLSSDGESWEEVDLGLPDELVVFQIVRGELGYLISGASGETSDASLWLSEDGLDWELVHDIQISVGFVAIDDIAAGDEGFVAFGTFTAQDHRTYERFTLASSDGREWIEQRRPFGADTPDYMPSVWVESLGPDWVAAIASMDASVRFWFSSDGLEWQESAALEDMGTDMTWDPVLVELDGELVFSPSGHNGLGVPGQAFSSTDGQTWEPMDLGEQLSLGAAAVGPDAHVLAGTVFDGQASGVATIWVRASR